MKSQQSGVALIITLLMLVLMTLLGLSSIRSGAMEQKMAVNFRDADMAFQAAEAGLRSAENDIHAATNEILPSSDGATGIWSLDIMDTNGNDTTSWWNEKDTAWWESNAAKQDMDLLGISKQPRVIVEYQYFVPDELVVGDGSTETGLVYYRITSRGTGGSDKSQSLLQSTFARRY